MNFNYECTFGWWIGMVVLPWWCIQRNDVMLKQHSLLVTSLSHPMPLQSKQAATRLVRIYPANFQGKSVCKLRIPFIQPSTPCICGSGPLESFSANANFKLTYFGYMFDSSENAAARNLPKAIGTELPSQPY